MAFTQGSEFATSLSATTAGTGSTFSVKVNSLTVINDGANTVYFSVVTTSGTTAGHPIKINESLSLGVDRMSHFAGCSVITSTSTGAGPTATVRVYGIRG